MFCCSECFGDRGLRKSIIPFHSASPGDCSYCGSKGLAVVAPTQLKEYFELLLSAYQPDETGRLLVDLFRDDWGLFRQPQMDDAHAQELLGEVLHDGEVVRRPFSPINAREADRRGEWENLREELKFRNRFFPSFRTILTRLGDLLSQLFLDIDEVGLRWHRARIQSDLKPLAAEEMGAPPHRMAAHGRANPAGIPYLYLGSTQHTSISEIRPHTGEIICVGVFQVAKGLKLIDLRDPKTMVSPFWLEDADSVAQLRADLPFLELLGDELTRPVVPQAAAVDYTPTQYLCEYIKNQGFDGVVYRSSVSAGINLALFDPTKAECGEVTQHRVTRVEVEAAQVG